MKTYHILFKNNKDDYTSIGVNMKGEDAHDALIKFNLQFPKAHFLCMYDLEEFSHLYR